MPKPKDPNAGREERERREREDAARHDHDGHEDERERPQDEEHPRRRRLGRDYAVHKQIVERRLSGGAPATPEAYLEGLRQWQQLPGAIVRTTTDERPDEKPVAPPKDETHDEG